MVPFYSLVSHPSPSTPTLPPLFVVYPFRFCLLSRGDNGQQWPLSQLQPSTTVPWFGRFHDTSRISDWAKTSWGGGGGRGGDGYKGRRHLVSPRGVSVCPERGCMIDQREEGKNHFGLLLFFPVSLAVCLVVLLHGVYSWAWGGLLFR